MTQLNTPYPATAYLAGFINAHADFKAEASHGRCWQTDFSIKLFLKLFSRTGLTAVFEHLKKKPLHTYSEETQFLLSAEVDYLNTVELVVGFLQGKNRSLANRMAARTFLPEGPRFQSLNQVDLDVLFGNVGVYDKAKHLASLYIDDLTDLISREVDTNFSLARYGDRLAASQITFEPLYQSINKKSLVTKILDELVDSEMSAFQSFIETSQQSSSPIVCITAPFPGNVLGAFQIAQVIKKRRPNWMILLGGGFVNTELRELSEPRVFEFFDAVTLDDGEVPLLQIAQHMADVEVSARNSLLDLMSAPLVRTFVRNPSNGQVVYVNAANPPTLTFKDAGTPSYGNLELENYVGLLELPNPMHRLWSDARWNKLTLAHGCYWKKCSFCDVSLDYIARYEPLTAQTIVDRMQRLAQDTGETGFHFVDEACPPSLLKALSNEIIQRQFVTSWWGNLRFEKAFNQSLTNLMADAGCIAVTGGLEVASPRLLKLMNKGVTVEQVANVAMHFSRSNIFVHAYLMYGFPTQTIQETVDSLEYVRQMFAGGCLKSAFWHRFSVTEHSPIGKNPSFYKIELQRPITQADVSGPVSIFAKNDVPFVDPSGVQHELLGLALNKALFNYMHGEGLKRRVEEWFLEWAADYPALKYVKKTVPNSWLEHALKNENS